MRRSLSVAMGVGVLVAVLLSGCTTMPLEPILAVDLSSPVYYRTPSGEPFVAQYGSLSDGTLHFVKLRVPGGREYTLPQVVSASGARYTDERELVWWTHQGTATVESRSADGTWVTRYQDLREVSTGD